MPKPNDPDKPEFYAYEFSVNRIPFYIGVGRSMRAADGLRYVRYMSSREKRGKPVHWTLSTQVIAVLAKYDIKPIVISSPVCRCTQTAEIAFGEYVTDPDLRQKSAEDTHREETFQAKASEMFRMYRGSNPIALVNHRPNIDSLTMELITIGDLLIGTVTETGEVEVVGKLRIDP